MTGRRLAFGALTLTCLGGLLAVLLHTSWVRWGDVSSWTAALATVAAAIGAFVAAHIAFNQLKDQREELSRQAEEQTRMAELQQLQIQELRQRGEAQRRAQATQVYVMCLPEQGDEGVFDVHPRWRNASALPVYNVIVHCYVGDKTAGQPVLEPVLEPGQQGEATGVWWDPAQGGGGIFTVTITFRDAAGVRWRMNDKGQLTEITEPS